MSTVIAAVIGAVVGSLGGAYLGVTVGADRDDERSNHEFWRTQRIALYGDYLAAADEAHSLMDPRIPKPWMFRADGTIDLGGLPTPSEENLRVIDESLRNVNTDAGQVQVIGGQEVDDLASELRFDLSDAHETVFRARDCIYCARM